MIRYNGYVIGKGGYWLKAAQSPLPPFTIRLKFTEGVTPTFRYGTAVQVSSSPNIWDLTYENSFWLGSLLNQPYYLLEVISGNTTGIVNMNSLFFDCTSLTSVCMLDTAVCRDMSDMFCYCRSLTNIPLFDTSMVTYMTQMFRECLSLTNIPLFDTSSVTNMNRMFQGCTNVQTGALALYQQASSQANPPTSHDNTFYDCGSETVTGAAELAQIPDDWK